MARVLRRLALAAGLAAAGAAGSPPESADACPVDAPNCKEREGAGEEDASLIQVAKLKEVPEERTRHVASAGRYAGYGPYKLDPNYQNPLCKSKRKRETQLVKQMTNAAIMDELKALTSLPSASTPSRSALEPSVTHPTVDYLVNEFKSMGLAVCTQSFSFRYGSFNGDSFNVIAYIPGTDPSLGSVTMGAHYDSRPFQLPDTAPGADDNGSGTAVVLATARAYSQISAPPKRTLYFVGFGAEEEGLFGSHFFVEALAGGAKGLPVACRPEAGFPAGVDHRAITLDMVGWKSPHYKMPTLTLETKPWSKDVTEEVAQASKRINQDKLDLRYNPSPFGSDHMSFFSRNYHAMLAIHGDDGSYPAYHQSSDVISNTDSQLMGMIARACAGGLMRMADINEPCT